MTLRNTIPAPEATFQALFEYCQAHGWAGHDPYDALNSRLLESFPGGKLKLPRLLATQLFKRSPINFRGLFGVPPTENPKALALNLRAILAVAPLSLVDTSGLITHFVERIAALRSRESDYWCWGYSFPWQTRTICVPRGAPNLVCTAFVADALLDVWEHHPDDRLLTMATSAASYLSRELYFEAPGGIVSFAYPAAGLCSVIYNANFLAAALLMRAHRLVPDELGFKRALLASRFSASRQRPDGSWPYGAAATQSWIDNFHTGYNLAALRSIGRSLASTEFDGNVASGFDFYKEHFLRDDGAPRYFHDKTYPIDIHCVAQTILTMLEFADLDTTAPDRALQTYNWAMRNMWNRGGFFYYRALRLMTIRIPYMRWSQAWMLLALAQLSSRHRSASQRLH
ncbi:MAG: hypothetical protein WCE48_01045 [Steroidobacteraceae bacterium]